MLVKTLVQSSCFKYSVDACLSLPRRSCSQFKIGSATKTGLVSVDGHRIQYLVKGGGDHVVFLLPGALGTPHVHFSPQLEALADHGSLTVVSWDPPGYGGSRPPARTFPRNYYHRDAALAARTMETLGYDRFSVVGWSDGGVTALVAAAQETERIRKVVVWGANAYVDKEDMDMFETASDLATGWAPRMKAAMEAVYGEEFPSLWKAVVDARRMIYESGGDIYGNELKKIIAPTLVIHGSKDAMLLGKHVDCFKEQIQGLRIHIFEEGGHGIHLKYKKEFNQIVIDFLNE